MTEGWIYSDHSRIYLWTISFFPSFDWFRWKKSEVTGKTKETKIGSTLQPVIRYYVITKIVLFLWVLLVTSLFLSLKRLCSLQSVQIVCPNILIPTNPSTSTNSYFPFHNRNSFPSQEVFPENPYQVVNTTSLNVVSSSKRRKLMNFITNSLQRMVQLPRFIQESIKKTPNLMKKLFSKVIRRSNSQKSSHSSINRSSQVSVNDHMEADIETFNLNPEQIQRVYSTYDTLMTTLTPELREKASVSGMRLTPYLVYQYLASTDWLYDYNGISFVDALFLTIQWRYDMYEKYYHDTDYMDLYHLIAGGMCYISYIPDRYQRAMDKMKVLSVNDVKKTDNVMVQRLGKYSLEEEYGGVITTSYSNDDYHFHLNEHDAL